MRLGDDDFLLPPHPSQHPITNEHQQNDGGGGGRGDDPFVTFFYVFVFVSVCVVFIVFDPESKVANTNSAPSPSSLIYATFGQSLGR